jgi:hypothetical protein
MFMFIGGGLRILGLAVALQRNGKTGI